MGTPVVKSRSCQANTGREIQIPAVPRAFFQRRGNAFNNEALQSMWHFAMECVAGSEVPIDGSLWKVGDRVADADGIRQMAGKFRVSLMNPF
jgi:hypothetical protein